MSGFHEGLLSGSQKSQETRTKHMKQVVWTIRPSFSSVKMIIVPTAGILLYFCLFIGCYRFIDDTNLIITAMAAVYTNCCLDLLKRFRDGEAWTVILWLAVLFMCLEGHPKAFSAAVSNIMLDVAVRAIITIGARLTGVSVAPKL